MGAIGLRARSELRSRRGWVGVALVAALGAGAVMTAAAGARRTDRAYGRFERAERAADVVIYPSFGAGIVTPPFAPVRKLPQVAYAAQLRFVPAELSDQQAVAVEYGEPPLGTEIDRVKILRGRAPRAPDEAIVGFTLAQRRHLRPGSRIGLRLAPAGNAAPGGPAVEVALRVTGIEASPGEFPPQFDSGFGGSDNFLHLAPAAFAALSGRVLVIDETVVRLRRGGADVPAFVEGVHRIVGGQPELNLIRSQQAANVQRSLHLQAVALWLLAALLALVTIGVVSQLLGRLAFVESGDHGALRALGMTPGQLWTLGMLRVVASGVTAAVLAAAAAVAASGLMPVGTARIAELHPGTSADVLVLALGAAATLTLMLVLSAWPAWRSVAASHRADPASADRRTPTVLARLTAAAALPPTVGAGVRMAFESGRGRTAVPVRSTLLAVVVAVAALVGTTSFAASLDHLLGTPRLYGWNWDAHVTATGDGDADAVERAIGGDRRIQALAAVDSPPLAIGAVQFDGLFLRQDKGTIEPIVLEGRAPRGDDEVALGTETMRRVHARVGSTVSLRITAIAPHPQTFRVVGRAVIRPQSDTARLGSGAVLDYAAQRRLVPPEIHPPPISDAELRLAPGVDRNRALADIRRRLGDAYALETPHRPADLVNFGRVQNLPLLLGSAVALLGAATLAQTLLTSIRRRRRDLSILKTLGFSPAQVRAAVAWQATAFVIVALAIGLPLGAGAGRVAWIILANRLGTVSEPVTPALALGLTVIGSIVVANLIAAAPAAIAARMRPAIALRTE